MHDTPQPHRDPPPRPDPRQELEGTCYTLGFDSARKSWALKSDPAMLRALEGKASALTQSVHRPSTEASEKRAQKKLTATEDELERRMAANERTRAVAQSRQEELAALGEPSPRPEIAPVLILAFTLGLALSIAPTIHDLLTGLDPVLKWLVGGLLAGGVGFLVVRGMMPPSASSAPSTKAPDAKAARKRQRGAFLAGLGVGVGLFGVRAAAGQAWGDLVFAGALTIVELSCVYLWETQTRRLEELDGDWIAAERERNRARSAAQAAADDLADRERLLEEQQHALATREAQIERDFLLSDLKALTAIALNAIRAGYHRGIAQNNGEVGGGHAH